MARELRVNIVGDTRDLERAFSRAERSARRFNRAIVGALGAGIAGVGFAKMFTDTVKAASNLQEQMSKTNAVFGQSSKELTKWSKTTATAFGISQRAALETASTFGALFGPLGITGKQAVDQSRRLTELGADLASFYNTDVQSALDAIRSGLVGESEPLRKYGALLSETRVAQEAMAATGKKSAASLTDQEKVLARINIIFGDTVKAQGDSARTAGNFAGQMKRLQAQAEDLQAALGETLLPSVTKLVTQFNLWLADPENKKQVIEGFAASVSTLGAAFKFAADTATALKNAWDKIPNWGIKNKGLTDFGGGGTGFLPDLTGFGGGGDFPADSGKPGGRGGTKRGGIGPRVSGKPVTDLFAAMDKWIAVGKKYADTQKALAKQRAQAELQRRRFAAGLENQQGWLQFGIERADATKGGRDDIASRQKYVAWLQKRIRLAGHTLTLTRELWRVQNEITNLNKAKAGPSAFHQVSASKVAAMLGVGGDRQALMILSALGRGGTLPGGSKAFTAGRGGVVVNGNVHVHGVTNTRQFTDELEKQNRGRPANRRGAR